MRLWLGIVSIAPAGSVIKALGPGLVGRNELPRARSSGFHRRLLSGGETGQKYSEWVHSASNLQHGILFLPGGGNRKRQNCH